MLNLLAIVKGSEVGKDALNWYFENKAEGLIYALIGFLVVFLGIALLIFVVWLIGLIMKKTNNLAFLTQKKQKKGKDTGNQVKSAVQQAEVTEEIPDEVKVAIMAAIMAYYEQEKPKSSFVVKRIKKL